MRLQYKRSSITKNSCMKKIILTGFEPFGPYEYNPTQESALDFDGKVFGDREVLGLVLPATYTAWGQLASLIIRTGGVYAVISTGLATSAQGVRIESTFHNLMNGKYPDANGNMPHNIPVLDMVSAPAVFHPKAPLKKLFSILKNNGIPVEYSNDADRFICNALGYNTSGAAKTSTSTTRNIFIHIPWTTKYADRVTISPGKIFLGHNEYYKALELLIRNI